MKKIDKTQSGNTGWDQMLHEVYKILEEDETWNKARYEIESQIADQVQDEVQNQFHLQIELQAWNRIRVEVEEQAWREIGIYIPALLFRKET